MAAFGLLRTRVALAEQLRLTLSYPVRFDAIGEHLDGLKNVGFRRVKSM